MLVVTRAVRSLRRRRLADDSGFTLIEVVVASGVLMVVMSGLAYLGTVAFTDIATARLRQTATALANEAVEQVRAMPYDTVSLGLKTSDLVGDPAITNDGTGYRFGGERIPNGDVPDLTPIVPHLSTGTTDDVAYTTGVYITYYNDDEYSGAYRVTAVVSWAASLRATTVRRVEVETVIFSPSCGSDPTHVFAAPCEPYFHAATAAVPGGITIGDSGSGTPLLGSTLRQMSLWLPQADTTLEGEQVTRVNTNVTTSGVTVRSSGTDTDTVVGRQSASAASSTDPSSTPPPPAHHSVSTGAQASSTTTVSGSGAALTYTSSAGDTAVATATVVAKASNPCSDESDPAVAQLNERPCGNGSTQQGGSMSTVLTVAGLADTTLASIGQPPSASSAHVARLAAASGARCPTAGIWGCGRAAHRQAIGPVRVAGLPGGFTPPLGFDYLMKVDDVVTTVSAEAGDGNANPSATRVGTLQYWNGIGYTSVGLSGSASVNVTVPGLEVLDLLTGNRVTMSATVRTGALDAPPCAAPCAEAVASAESAVVADILYKVEVGGVTVADLLIRVDLGTLTARAAYKVTV